MSIVTYILAAVFLMAGAMKVMQPKAKLETNMSWVKVFTSGQVKTLGAEPFLTCIDVTPFGNMTPMFFQDSLRPVAGRLAR